MSRRKSRTHEVKCWPSFYTPIEDGTKPFEIRKNDRDYAVGDTLYIREWCPRDRDYTGRECWRVVSYVTAWQQSGGNVVLGLKPAKSTP